MRYHVDVESVWVIKDQDKQIINIRAEKKSIEINTWQINRSVANHRSFENCSQQRRESGEDRQILKKHVWPKAMDKVNYLLSLENLTVESHKFIHLSLSEQSSWWICTRDSKWRISLRMRDLIFCWTRNGQSRNGIVIWQDRLSSW